MRGRRDRICCMVWVGCGWVKNELVYIRGDRVVRDESVENGSDAVIGRDGRGARRMARFDSGAKGGRTSARGRRGMLG